MPCLEGVEDKRFLTGLRLDNVVRAGGEEMAGDDGGWGLGLWLVAVR